LSFATRTNYNSKVDKDHPKDASVHKVCYILRIPDAEQLEFTLEFTAEDFSIRIDEQRQWPSWTKLSFQCCSHCPLDEETSPHCPLARSLVEVVDATSRLISYSQVDVEVILPSRRVNKLTTAQVAMRSLMGLIIPASGCPYTAFFKPMARYHLPFSDERETLYRASSMYLMAQHIRRWKGLDWEPGFTGLGKIYADLNIVNRHMVERLQGIGSGDSSLNALVLLDVFAVLLPLRFEEAITELLNDFAAFLSDD
jgi:hypothetical protein